MRMIYLLLMQVALAFTSHDGFCEKNFFYHQIHGYGYDIKCEKLNNQTFSELSSATVYNEIRLAIKSSVLHAVKWHVSNNLPRLKEITIVDSVLIDSNLFANLNDLKILKITNSTVNDNSYAGVNGLLNLNKLILNNNSLTHLKFNRTIYNLEFLDLDNNLFERLIDISPCTFPYLEQLSLRNNKLFDVTNTSCLENLAGLYLDHNNIEHLKLDLPKLNTLGLSYNKLKTFKESLGKMIELQHLNLEGNDLSSVQTDNFIELVNLKYLNLKRNKLNVLANNVFAHNSKLQFVNLCNNKITKISLNVSSITDLLLSNNQIKSIDFVRSTNSLNKLDLSLNKINEIPAKVFDNFTSLTFLNLSFNKLQNLHEDSFYGLNYLLQLDLSNTDIREFKSATNLSNLKVLNVSNNNLSNFTGFENLHFLETLNVSYNRLVEVKLSSIANLKRLRVIDLEGNSLKAIEYVKILSELPSLQVINIRNNSLPCEFLDEMIGYFKNNDVNFTVDSKLNYDKENVAGIYCKQREIVINTERLTSKQEHEENDGKHGNSVKSDTSAILISLGGVCVALLTLFFGFRLHFRRKNYVTDTVQLLDR